MIHVPYKGLGPALTDLHAGHVDLMFDNQQLHRQVRRAGPNQCRTGSPPDGSAQILLHHVQDGFPQWAAITKDGEFVTNRRRHGRHKDARLRFNPKLLFSINWATSGPGFEGPEAY